MPINPLLNPKDLVEYYQRNQNFFLPYYADTSNYDFFLSSFSKAPMGISDKENIALIYLVNEVFPKISDFSKLPMNLNDAYIKAYELFLSLQEINQSVLKIFESFIKNYLICLYKQSNGQEYKDSLPLVIDLFHKNKNHTKFYNTWLTIIVNCLFDEIDVLQDQSQSLANYLLDTAEKICCIRMDILQKIEKKDDATYRKIISLGLLLCDIYRNQLNEICEDEILGLIRNALSSIENRSQEEEQLLSSLIVEHYDCEEELVKIPTSGVKRSSEVISKAECTTSESEIELVKKIRPNPTEMEKSPVNEEDKQDARKVSYFFLQPPQEVVVKEDVAPTGVSNPPPSPKF